MNNQIIDIPGVKELVEAAFRAGLNNGEDRYVFEDEMASEYIKALEAKDE